MTHRSAQSTFHRDIRCTCYQEKNKWTITNINQFISILATKVVLHSSRLLTKLAKTSRAQCTSRGYLFTMKKYTIIFTYYFFFQIPIIFSQFLDVSRSELNGSLSCFVNFVTSKNYTNEKKIYSIESFDLYTLIYTVYEVRDTPWLLDDHDDDEVDNGLDETLDFILRDKTYFRNHVKHRDNCIIFFIYANTFLDVINAISYSGYGKTDETLFFVQAPGVNQENEIIREFKINLFDSDVNSFHAPIVFFSLANSAIFCYFCPTDKIQSIRQRDLQSMRKLNFQLNSEGYQNAIVPLDADELPMESACFKLNAQTRDEYLRMVGTCSGAKFVLLMELKRILNYTLHWTGRTPRSSWFLQFRPSELLGQATSLDIVENRGSFFISDQRNLRIIACMNSNELFEFDYSVLTVIKWPLAAALMVQCLVIAFIYKNLCRGFDLLWLLIEITPEKYHPRKILVAILIPFAIISIIYQSHLSSDSVTLIDFPTLLVLFRKYKYKLRVRDDGAYTLIDTYISRRLKKTMVTFSGYKTFYDLFYHGADVSFRVVLTTVKIMARKRLAVFEIDLMHLMEFIGNGMVLVGDNYYCQSHDANNLFSMPATDSDRFWSYMGTRMTKFWRFALEGRILQRIESLYFEGVRSRGFDGVSIRESERFKISKALGLNSTLGYTYYASLALLSINLAIYFTIKKRPYWLWKMSSIFKRRVVPVRKNDRTQLRGVAELNLGGA